jgi:hypothetical protein
MMLGEINEHTSQQEYPNQCRLTGEQAGTKTTQSRYYFARQAIAKTTETETSVTGRSGGRSLKGIFPVQ